MIRNNHSEDAREEDYDHLKDLWLSDVRKSSENLEVDVLVREIICSEVVLGVVRLY